jgi:hypothetical protein
VTATVTDLSWQDLRDPAYRRETFQRFYTFHLRYGTHPGCVYHLLPGLAELEGWDTDQKAWAALLNGHTENPITTWLLMQVAPGPEDWPKAVRLWRDNYTRLAWDTDRRYHRKSFGPALEAMAAAGQLNDWLSWWTTAGSWRELWRRALALPTFGRMSAWSFLEYGWLLGLHPHDADSFLLADDGSKSHRLGTAWVAGLSGYDPHNTNPDRTGEPWPPRLTGWLDQYLEEELLPEARTRNPDSPHVGRLTLESALCTYKSWHRPNRRYPNVYADMAHDRIRSAEAAWPDDTFGAFWEIRRRALPARLRLEDNPGDPGCVPVKQNWYRQTGRPPMMEGDWPDMQSGWPDLAATGRLARLRRFK